MNSYDGYELSDDDPDDMKYRIEEMKMMAIAARHMGYKQESISIDCTAKLIKRKYRKLYGRTVEIF